MTTYTFTPIPADVADHLREVDDAGASSPAFVTAEGGDPLRCCLTRSRPGERIMLVAYAPLRRWAARTAAMPGAYDEVGPVFIHAERCSGPAGGFPGEVIRSRKVFRSYDTDGRILGGALVDPAPGHVAEVAEAALDAAFADPATAIVHVRAVEFGCFLTEVARPDTAAATPE